VHTVWTRDKQVLPVTDVIPCMCTLNPLLLASYEVASDVWVGPWAMARMAAATRREHDEELADVRVEQAAAAGAYTLPLFCSI